MKKLRTYEIILVLLVIIAIVLTTLVIKKHINGQKVEEKTQSILESITMQETDNEEFDIIQEIDAEIDGYSVVGIIKIPKIEIEYPILEKTNKESLKLSITKFWGDKINQKGNVVLAGHNNFNKKFFGRLNKLEIGDIIELTDKQRVTVKYSVFKIYKVDPNDITCIMPVDENSREVTLITCTNGKKERLIVKAREIVETNNL